MKKIDPRQNPEQIRSERCACHWKMLGMMLLIFVLAAGCGEPDSRTKITFLQILGGKDRDKIVDSMIARFEAAHPDIDIIPQSVPWNQSHEKIVTMIATDNVPDVIEIADAWIGEFGNMGALGVGRQRPGDPPQRYRCWLRRW